MRAIDADAIEYTHAIARSLDDGHNWNELCVTKDEIEDMPTIQPERIRGRWIPVGGALYKCDQCGAVSLERKFCSDCGAEMEVTT